MEEVQSEEPQENAEPTMINVRSEGLKLDLVLLKNKVSGLTIDYQNISKSDELRKWIRIVEGMTSRPAPLPEESIPQILNDATRAPVPRPRHQMERQEEPSNERQEEPTMEKQEEPTMEKQEEPTMEKQEEPTMEKQEELTMEKQAESLENGGQEEPPREKEKQEGHPEDNGYRKVVLRAVDVSLDTLGHDGKQAILSLLENRYGFRENDIPDYPRSFIELLGELLGMSSQSLEREIISNIRKVWAAPGENLETVVESLKEHLPAAAPAEAAAEDLGSVATDANKAGFRYRATYSRHRE